jgi:hypothetical protein
MISLNEEEPLPPSMISHLASFPNSDLVDLNHRVILAKYRAPVDYCTWDSLPFFFQ